MVLYYSRTKKTKIFAEVLGEVLNMSVYELESDLNKKSIFSFMFKALSLAFSGKSYPVSNMPVSLPTEIYVCGPVWGGGIAGPSKFFLENADLRDTTVNLLITASIPVEKYRQNALNLLNGIPCKPGEAYIFATSDKSMPDANAIKEQLQEMVK